MENDVICKDPCSFDQLASKQILQNYLWDTLYLGLKMQGLKDIWVLYLVYFKHWNSRSVVYLKMGTLPQDLHYYSTFTSSQFKDKEDELLMFNNVSTKRER